MRRPCVVTIGTAGQTVDSVEQRVVMLSEGQKMYAGRGALNADTARASWAHMCALCGARFFQTRNKLLELLQSGFEAPIIIFLNEKKGADVLSRALEKLGVRR